MASIQEVWQKIKVFSEIGLSEWGMVVVVLLIAFSSFGLGRLSAFAEEKGHISISKAPSAPQALAMGGMYEAARGGSVYYFPWCAGAEAIQPENQVWFKTETAAQNAGYLPAKNCKGLTE